MYMQDLGRWFEYLDNGRILCNHSDSLALVDCRTDSVLVDSSLAASAIAAVAHTGDGSKVYLIWHGRLEARSSTSLALLDTIGWPYLYHATGEEFLLEDDSTRKLYWFANPDSILAIDATSDTVVARWNLDVPPGCACLDRTGRYLFCLSYPDSCLRVYDTQSDSLVTVYWHLPLHYPISITSSPGHVYVACPDVILAYSDAPLGICEEPASTSRRPMQTVFRGVLVLDAADNGQQAVDRGELLDAAGRKVLELHSGANDVRRLAPGVYFIREGLGVRGEGLGKAQKVVVTR